MSKEEEKKGKQKWPEMIFSKYNVKIMFSLQKVVFELKVDITICCEYTLNSQKCAWLKNIPAEVSSPNYFVSPGSKDIKSSLRGAKLPNGQPMLLDEEQNSLALLIEQVEIGGRQLWCLEWLFEARYELNCGDPKIAETYMNQAMTINDLEPLVKIVRGGCKV